MIFLEKFSVMIYNNYYIRQQRRTSQAFSFTINDEIITCVSSIDEIKLSQIRQNN